MMVRMKERVTISLEPEALAVAKAQVEAGEAASVSAAVEDALRARSKSRAIREAVELWEEEFGPISEEAREWARKELTKAFAELSSLTQER
jgi:Arc/MetJ-type ribon-helix-helix transcriptional regulator